MCRTSFKQTFSERYVSKLKEILIAPNILERNFKAVTPNQKWATDITQFNVLGNKLYLAHLIDLFNQE